MKARGFHPSTFSSTNSQNRTATLGGFLFGEKHVKSVEGRHHCSHPGVRREDGRAPKYAELLNHFPQPRWGRFENIWGHTRWRCGERPGLPGGGLEVAMDELFRDWALIVRKMKKLPTMTEYETRASTASVR